MQDDWNDDKEAELARLRAECRAEVGDDEFERIEIRVMDYALGGALDAAESWGVNESGHGIPDVVAGPDAVLIAWRIWRDL